MTKEEAITVLKELKEFYNNPKYYDCALTREDNEAIDLSIIALKEWKEFDYMTKERIIRARKLIEEFEEKHTIYSFIGFNEYIEDFSNHSINDIQDFMWDMFKLIEDIKFRIPKEGD